jgi:hypothetical protein
VPHGRTAGTSALRRRCVGLATLPPALVPGLQRHTLASPQRPVRVCAACADVMPSREGEYHTADGLRVKAGLTAARMAGIWIRRGGQA